MQIGKGEEKSSITKIKNKDKNLVGRQRLKDEVDLKEQTCELIIMAELKPVTFLLISLELHVSLLIHICCFVFLSFL